MNEDTDLTAGRPGATGWVNWGPAPMSVLTATPRPIDLAPRPRVWAGPELVSHAGLVFAPDHLLLCPHADGPDTVLPLAAVRKARLDLLANALTLDAGAAGPVTLTFAGPEAADACFTQLWRELGDGFELLPYRRNPRDLARTPLLVLAAVLLITAALAVLAGVAEEFAAARAVSVGPLPASSVERLFGWLNWKAVCLAGGAGSAAAQVWLYRRLTQPPATLELVRG
jgi:hypothetical protein